MIARKKDKSGRASTSIRIDPDLWREARIEAIKRDLEVSELIDIALRKELKKPVKTF